MYQMRENADDVMRIRSRSGYRQIHLSLPSWLMERIYEQAEAVGQTPTAEIKRALVDAFGKKEDGDNGQG